MRISDRKWSDKRPKSHSKPQLMSGLGRQVERVSYLDLLLFAVFELAISALILSSSTFGCLLAKNGEDFSAGFFEALYFSFVTFTSLGYGDISPIGFGRLIAVVLVLSGLALIALLISKLGSERSSTAINLLHRSDVERRIAGFSDEISTRIEQCRELLKQEKHEELSKSFRDLIEADQRTSQFLVFHAHQSTSLVHGNDSALRHLIKQCNGAQEVCFDVHQFANAKGIYSLDNSSMALSKRLYWSVKFILSLHYEAMRPQSLSARALDAIMRAEYPKTQFLLKMGNIGDEMKKRISNLQEWRRRSVTLDLLQKIESRLPTGPAGKWPKGVHKKIAIELGISNSLCGKCISRLFEESRIPKGL